MINNIILLKKELRHEEILKIANEKYKFTSQSAHKFSCSVNFMILKKFLFF